MNDEACLHAAARLGPDADRAPTTAERAQLRAHLDGCTACSAAYGPDLALCDAFETDDAPTLDEADVRRAAAVFAARGDEVRRAATRGPAFRRAAAAVVVAALGFGVARRACAPDGADPVAPSPPAPRVVASANAAASDVVRAAAASPQGSVLREVRRDGSGVLSTVRTLRAAPPHRAAR
jgi:hypothetical protein